MLNRSQKPLPSGEIKFHPPTVEQAELVKGVKLHFVKKDKLPIVQVLLLLNSGSCYDNPEKSGTANLTAMLIDEGAGGLTALELSDRFDSLGASFNIYCNSDTTTISLLSLKENLDEGLELVSKVLRQPHFDQKDFDREKRKVLTAILQLRDQPDQIADQVFKRIIYENSPYGFPLLGYKESVSKIDNDEIKNFHNNYYLPDNSEIVVVGDSRSLEIISTLNKVFTQWYSGKAAAKKLQPIDNPASRIFIVNKSGAPQTEIRVGHLSTARNTADYFAKLLLNTILGGQFTSRINLNLRERRGFTYGAFSSFSYYKESGFFSVSTSVGTENTIEAVSEILKEMKMIRESISQKELVFAKSALVRKYPSSFETYNQVAANIGTKIIHSLPEDYFDTYIDKINACTISDLIEAAESSILPEQAVIVLVGDKNKLSPDLDKADIGEFKLLNYNGSPLN